MSYSLDLSGRSKPDPDQDRAQHKPEKKKRERRDLFQGRFGGRKRSTPNEGGQQQCKARHGIREE